MLANHLSLRQLGQRIGAGTGSIVNFFLIFRHCLAVFLEGDELLVLCRIEHHQVAQLFLVCAVICIGTRLDGVAKSVPEFDVFFALILLHLEQFGADFLFQADGDCLELTVVLQHFAGDVQRQIRGINQTAHKAEVIRQQVGALFHNHNTGGVQRQTLGEVLGIVVKRRLRRNVQQGVIGRSQTLVVEVNRAQRLHVIHELAAVELIVLVLRDVLLCLLPQRNHRVQRVLGVNGFVFRLVILRCILRLRLFLRMRHLHLNRVTDVVGILANQTCQTIGLQEFAVGVLVLAFRIRLDGQDNVCAIGILLARLDGVAVCAVRLPDICLLGAARLRNDLDVRGNHKRSVEADAELAYDVGIIGLVLLLECQRTALCDGAEVVFQFFLGHTDAVIGNGQGACVFIRCQMNFKALLWYEGRIGQGLEVALVNRITCIGDQLAQENFSVRVDRVNHHVQQTLGFCLKLLLCHCMSILSDFKLQI